MVSEWPKNQKVRESLKVGFKIRRSFGMNHSLCPDGAWDWASSPKDYCPKAQNLGTVPEIVVPWDDFGTVKILGTYWDSSPMGESQNLGLSQVVPKIWVGCPETVPAIFVPWDSKFGICVPGLKIPWDLSPIAHPCRFIAKLFNLQLSICFYYGFDKNYFTKNIKFWTFIISSLYLFVM